jgi:hypothetical protein
MPETKPKQGDALRIPKPKKKLGLTVPPALRMPHEDLISPAVEPQPLEEQAPLTLPSQTSRSSQTSPTSLTSHTSEEHPVAPQRDYMKMANSIGREAVPAGIFTGKSKQLYDCLYAMTRGAIVPTRTVRISRPKLMAKAHIGSRITFDANVDRLLAVGLITVRKITGEHEGNEYTVNLPEEIDFTMTSQTSQTTMTSLTSSAQKLDRLVRLETSHTSHTSSPIDSTVSEGSKTSFKTKKENDDDDAALAGLFATLREATKQVTGRDLSASERDRWRELGEVLATELKIAAARTTVSSAPAFLAEHLRRRLWNKDKKQMVEEQQAEQTESTQRPLFTPEQLRECPDCFGTGMYYPEGTGFGKAVARCKHERLKREVE